MTTAGPPALPAGPAALWMTRHRAVDAVRYLAAGLDHRRPGTLERLRVDAEAEIDAWDDLDIHLVLATDRSIVDSGCSTYGMYQSGTRPPRLVIASSRSHGRNNFTILHELAHHLQRTDPDWRGDVLADVSQDQALRLEHRVCDEFASVLLLPDSHWPPTGTSRPGSCARSTPPAPRPGLRLSSEPAVSCAHNKSRSSWLPTTRSPSTTPAATTSPRRPEALSSPTRSSNGPDGPEAPK